MQVYLGIAISLWDCQRAAYAHGFTLFGVTGGYQGFCYAGVSAARVATRGAAPNGCSLDLVSSCKTAGESCGSDDAVALYSSIEVEGMFLHACCLNNNLWDDMGLAVVELSLLDCLNKYCLTCGFIVRCFYRLCCHIYKTCTKLFAINSIYMHWCHAQIRCYWCHPVPQTSPLWQCLPTQLPTRPPLCHSAASRTCTRQGRKGLATYAC